MLPRVPSSPAAAPTDNFSPDPHVDYRRALTPEGGIAITYKDLDERLRHILIRALLWASASGIDGWILLRHSPVASPWLNVAFLVVTLVINWLIVSGPVVTYRSVEIRPDAMILNGGDVFWTGKMESWPAFTEKGGQQVLSGIYGTRFVEYLAVRRLDEFDRTPEVLATHLQQAIQQMWTRPF